MQMQEKRAFGIPIIAGVGLMALAIYRAQTSAIPPLPAGTPKIMLDPGHGGQDPGAVVRFTANGKAHELLEADCNLAVSLTAQMYLAQHGAKIIMTRNSNRQLTIAERQGLIRQHRPDVFVSVHHDCIDGTAIGTTGVISKETKLSNPILGQSSESLAWFTAQSTGKVAAMGRSSYSIKTSTDLDLSGINYGVLRACREVGVPGVLLETAFMVDPEWQRAYITNSTFKSRIGQALGEGIMQYVMSLRTTAHVVNY